jgi:multiple sugar transport system substrate-binding protein
VAIAQEEHVSPIRRDSVFSRRQVVGALGALPVAGGLLLPPSARAAGGSQRFRAPAVIRPQSGQEVVHWVYSSLPLDKTTLQRVPPTTTENTIEYFEWSVEEFKKVEPGITVKLEYLPHDESWFAKIDSSLVAGAPPDVVQGPVSEAAKYIPLGALSPIDEYITEEDKTDLVAAVVAESSFDGQNYLWPWRLSFGGGIQINAGLWEQHGAGDLLPKGETRRWLMDDYLKALQLTTVDTNGDGTTDLYGTVLMTDIHYHVTQFLFGFGARLFNEDETEVILNSQEGVDGLQWLVDLEQVHKVAVPGSAVRKAAEADQIFIEGKAASYPSQGAGVRPASLDANPDFKWFWAPPPNVPGKEPAVMTNVHGHYVFQQQDADRTAAAHRWTQFLTRPEALALSLDQFGMPPARQSLWGEVTDENQKVGLRFTDIMVSFGRRASAAPITFSLVPRMLEAAFSGQKTPKQALDDLASEGNRLIEEAIADAS